MAFPPLPRPGLAILPEYVSSRQEVFYIKGEMFSRDFSITHADGRPWLYMDSETLSFSHRKTIIDAATRQKLCQIRRSGMGGDYYAEDGYGKKLFDIAQESMGTSRWAIHFPNANAGGRQERLEYKSNSRFNPRDGVISWQGQPVAAIEKQGWGSKSFVVQVAPGLDPFIIIGLLIAIEDKRRSRRNGTGAAAAGAGGAI